MGNTNEVKLLHLSTEGEKVVEVGNHGLLTLPDNCLRWGVGVVGLSVDEFEKRQRVWIGKVGRLVDLIDSGIKKSTITDDFVTFKMEDEEKYYAEFANWQKTLAVYTGAVDLQALMSDGSDETEVRAFLEKMAKTAMDEGFVDKEKCEAIGISF